MLVLACATLAACATYSSRQSTAEELTTILAGSQRSEANRARDVYRHPRATLLFFGVRPEMSVLEGLGAITAA
jgi:predicted methyltransferase